MVSSYIPAAHTAICAGGMHSGGFITYNPTTPLERAQRGIAVFDENEDPWQYTKRDDDEAQKVLTLSDHQAAFRMLGKTHSVSITGKNAKIFIDEMEPPSKTCIRPEHNKGHYRKHSKNKWENGYT